MKSNPVAKSNKDNSNSEQTSDGTTAARGSQIVEGPKLRRSKRQCQKISHHQEEKAQSFEQERNIRQGGIEAARQTKRIMKSGALKAPIATSLKAAVTQQQIGHPVEAESQSRGIVLGHQPRREPFKAKKSESKVSNEKMVATASASVKPVLSQEAPAQVTTNKRKNLARLTQEGTKRARLHNQENRVSIQIESDSREGIIAEREDECLEIIGQESSLARHTLQPVMQNCSAALSSQPNSATFGQRRRPKIKIQKLDSTDNVELSEVKKDYAMNNGVACEKSFGPVHSKVKSNVAQNLNQENSLPNKAIKFKARLVDLQQQLQNHSQKPIMRGQIDQMRTLAPIATSKMAKVIDEAKLTFEESQQDEEKLKSITNGAKRKLVYSHAESEEAPSSSDDHLPLRHQKNQELYLGKSSHTISEIEEDSDEEEQEENGPPSDINMQNEQQEEPAHEAVHAVTDTGRSSVRKTTMRGSRPTTTPCQGARRGRWEDEDFKENLKERIALQHKQNPKTYTTGPTKYQQGGGNKGHWNQEEDEKLTRAVEQFGGKNWKQIAKQLNDRTDVQCLHRWQKVLNPDLIKGPWSKEEDLLLLQLVYENEPQKWTMIAEYLHGRIGKQCRERWHNHLNPFIKKVEWNNDEELILFITNYELKNKWSDIAQELQGRTDNTIKNHWNSSMKKKIDRIIDQIKFMYQKHTTCTDEDTMHANMLLYQKNVDSIPASFKNKFYAFQDELKSELIEKVQKENIKYFRDKAKEYFNSDVNEDEGLLRRSADMIIKKLGLKPSDYRQTSEIRARGESTAFGTAVTTRQADTVEHGSVRPFQWTNSGKNSVPGKASLCTSNFTTEVPGGSTMRRGPGRPPNSQNGGGQRLVDQAGKSSRSKSQHARQQKQQQSRQVLQPAPQQENNSPQELVEQQSQMQQQKYSATKFHQQHPQQHLNPAEQLSMPRINIRISPAGIKNQSSSSYKVGNNSVPGLEGHPLNLNDYGNTSEFIIEPAMVMQVGAGTGGMQLPSGNHPLNIRSSYEPNHFGPSSLSGGYYLLQSNNQSLQSLIGNPGFYKQGYFMPQQHQPQPHQNLSGLTSSMSNLNLDHQSRLQDSLEEHNFKPSAPAIVGGHTQPDKPEVVRVKSKKGKKTSPPPRELLEENGAQGKDHQDTPPSNESPESNNHLQTPQNVTVSHKESNGSGSSWQNSNSVASAFKQCRNKQSTPAGMSDITHQNHTANVSIFQTLAAHHGPPQFHGGNYHEDLTGTMRLSANLDHEQLFGINIGPSMRPGSFSSSSSNLFRHGMHHHQQQSQMGFSMNSLRRDQQHYQMEHQAHLQAPSLLQRSNTSNSSLLMQSKLAPVLQNSSSSNSLHMQSKPKNKIIHNINQQKQQASQNQLSTFAQIPLPRKVSLDQQDEITPKSLGSSNAAATSLTDMLRAPTLSLQNNQSQITDHQQPLLQRGDSAAENMTASLKKVNQDMKDIPMECGSLPEQSLQSEEEQPQPAEQKVVESQVADNAEK